ncbi:MAG: UDP-N-acetylmuramoyl-tripeptide--D-alanyl-D-alanine ligase [Flavobacteriia bacterium]|nr:UDP-N-acetylmuramoyl-tripeptide--D-alanyl-D-alanine ligase [Flavobacteriia bacterium]
MKMEKLFDLFYQCNGVSTDSRKIEENSLFIALSGKNFNGNEFALESIQKGARFAIVDDKLKADNKNIFYVENTLVFLQRLANYHRNQFKIPVLAITGSNGKTTSKELINTVLSKKYSTLATVGNLNNHIGVPLTLLRLNKSHQIAIIEMGANKPGDINELCTIANPNFGLITNIGKAHLEGFGSFDGVLKTKKELYDYIEKEEGTLFFNSDDTLLKKHLPRQINSVSYGTVEEELLINGKYLESKDYVQLKWTHKHYESPLIQTKIVGKYNFYNLLAAICVGYYFNVLETDINEAINSYESTNNRSQIIKKDNYIILLDAYNANPSSMKSALESFSQMPEKEKTVILGDMFELGDFSALEHEMIVDWCNRAQMQTHFVGEEFYKVKISHPNLHFWKSKENLIQHLKENKINATSILLKASRGIGLEEILDYL